MVLYPIIIISTIIFLYLAYLFIPQIDLWLWQAKKYAKINGPFCALTFDDGPSQWTKPILDILRQHNIQATFFVTGQKAQQFPEVIKRMLNEGHFVGNHTMNHKKLTFLSKPVVLHEIQSCNKILRKLGDFKPTLFRAPHGFKRFGLRKILNKFELKLIPWTKGIWDTDMPSKEELVKRVEKKLHPLEILLLHDGVDNRPIAQNRQATVDALPEIIAVYKRNGYKFVNISDLRAKSVHPKPGKG